MRQASLMVRPTTAVALPAVPAGLLQRKCACGGIAGADGQCVMCRTTSLRRQPAEQTVSANVPPVVYAVLRAPGQPLDPATRAYFEPRFAHDFSGVRVHTDDQAAESARAVSARAYTVGREIVFGAGEYAPERGTSRQLIAHELAHVIQQAAGGMSPSAMDTRLLEADADQSARVAVCEGGDARVGVAAGPGLARNGIPITDADRRRDADRIMGIVQRWRVSAAAEQEILDIVERHAQDPAQFDEFLIVLRNRHYWGGLFGEHYRNGLMAISRELSGARLARFQTLLRTRSRRFGDYRPPSEITFMGSLWEDVVSGQTAAQIFGFLRGMGEAGMAFADSLIMLVTRPDEFVLSLTRLPEAVQTFWRNRRALWQRFMSAPPEEQARIIGRLTGEIEILLATSGAGGSGSAASTARAIPALRPAVVVSATGEAAMQTARTATRLGPALQETGRMAALMTETSSVSRSAAEIQPPTSPSTGGPAPRSRAPRATPTRTPPPPTGLARLDPQVQQWLQALRQTDAARAQEVSRSLAAAGNDIIDAINRFWNVRGFQEVVANYVAGGNMQQGARFVMRYAREHFPNPAGRAIAFEMPTMAGMRRLDLFVDGIRYEFKSVMELAPQLVRGRGGRFGQVPRDLIYQLGSDFSRLRNLRWVFDSARIGLTREQIVQQLQQLVRESNLFRDYPRIDEVMQAIDHMVILWP